ncbi:hypothetical protein ACQPZF_22620 [Actinosynnema sp. CS-041913]|uniref:hypothetical protein n=1 Tax=Actinosynnema sp. CS-041913 TaxID=3239917 RepID=UPI003D94D9FD
MGEHDQTADAALGEPVLPAASGIGSRNAALAGGAPQLAGTSIYTLDGVPSTVSFDKMDT